MRCADYLFIGRLIAEEFSGLIADIAQRYRASCYLYEREDISSVYMKWPTHLISE